MLNAAELPNFVNLVKAHRAAVVNISIEKEAYQQPLLSKKELSEESHDLSDDFVKRFFQNEDSLEDDRADFLASGFILSSDGYVVTNHHVVTGADKIVVKLSDRRELPATLIGSDKRSDIALLKIEGTNFPALKVGSSSQLEVGEWVVAIGSPFGFDHSVTAGIVSAKGRSLPTESYVPFIQTDVAINPGNSGGPLFNLKGEVVGINSQIYSLSGNFMGVSFAIPADVVTHVVAQLKATGYVKRGLLGVYIQEVTVDLAKSFGLKEPSGALIAEVLKKGPAISILQQGDIILEFNHKKIEIASNLPIIVGSTPIDRDIDVKIRRNGQTLTVKLRLAELPPPKIVAKKQKRPKLIFKNNTILGMELDNLTLKTRQELQIKEGVLVTSVSFGAGHKAGIQTGDIIRKFNGKSISDIKQFKLLVNRLPNGTPIAALVLRDSAAQFVAFMIEHEEKTQ
jgi:serine protease Do